MMNMEGEIATFISDIVLDAMRRKLENNSNVSDKRPPVFHAMQPIRDMPVVLLVTQTRNIFRRAEHRG